MNAPPPGNTRVTATLSSASVQRAAETVAAVSQLTDDVTVLA